MLREFLRIQDDINKIKDLTEEEKSKINKYYKVYSDIISDLKNENILINNCNKHQDFYE